MYFIFSYQFVENSQVESDVEKSIDEIMSKSFQNVFSPFKGLMIIECEEESVRKFVSSELLNLAKHYKIFKFVMTPLINSSGINGFFEKKNFEKLQKVIQNTSSSIYGGGLAF